jgi:hypothetical protein
MLNNADAREEVDAWKKIKKPGHPIMYDVSICGCHLPAGPAHKRIQRSIVTKQQAIYL